MKSLVSNLLIFSGVVLLLVAAFLIWQRINPGRLSFAGLTMVASQENGSNFGGLKPSTLQIKDLNILVPVVPGTKTGNRWETTTKGVTYLTSSPIPGETGNSIFYGHNWQNILGKLEASKPGQVIEIGYSDGTVKKFRIEYVQKVTPDQIGILDNTSDKRLTLYTCTGFLDRQRLVVTAFLVD